MKAVVAIGGLFASTVRGSLDMADAPYIALDGANFMGGPRLLITASPVSPSGSDLPAQKLLLDTGSSTLAFCDSSLTESVKSLQSQYVSCNVYGSETAKEGYWGYFYKGAVQLSNSDIRISNAYYSIIQQQTAMPCVSGVHGIFGIAFHQLDQATTSAPTDWGNGVGTCSQPSTDFVQPLMQFLNSKGGSEKVGIYWSGKVGTGEGQLYLDDDAVNNPHYNAEQAAIVGKAKLGTFGWYDIDVQSVEYNGQTFSEITCDPENGSPCIMDTGTPVLVIPQGAYDAMTQSPFGDLSVKLQGADGGSVTLKFDAQTLLDNQWVQGAPQTGVILGLPMRAFYYTVMDITSSSVSFTPMAAFQKHIATSVMV